MSVLPSLLCQQGVCPVHAAFHFPQLSVITANVETSTIQDKPTTTSRYILPSDRRESERLELQNRVLKKAFGDVLFAPLTFNDGDTVLDSGTGTACWLVDCHDAVKEEVHYYGIDITQKLFPVLNDDVTSRIHLSGGNILNLEGEWSERVYKLVNQRLLIAGLSAEEWKTAIGNIYKVLSPGGWVQLVETNHCRSGDTTERYLAVLKRIMEKRGLLLDPVRMIPDLLHEAGFVGTGTREYEVSVGKWAGEDGIEARESFIGVHRGLKHPVVNEMIMSSPDFDSLVDEMEQEWDNMPGSKIMFNIFYAQKPE